MKNLIFAFLILTSVSLNAQTEKLVDIDGNTYKTVLFNNQLWMAENLRTTKFNDGTLIPLVANSLEWRKLTQPAYCWHNNDEANNQNQNGALYNWYAVETGKLCPTGWHVPTDKVWLSKAYLPVGYRDENGLYTFVKNTSFYWTSTENSITEAYQTGTFFDGSEVLKSYTLKKYGLSVRCIKNDKY
jgi:hypothetical protein